MHSHMIRRAPFAWLAAAAILVLPALSHSTLQAGEITDLVKKAEPAIVTVIGYDGDGSPSQLGTGFFISRRGHLITNRHVLAGVARAEVKGKSGQVYPITRVIAEDLDGDLVKVAVDIPFTRVRTLRIAEKEPEAGESIVVIGSPFGLEQTVTNGIVSTVRDVEDIGRFVQITAPISHGSSGSPVMDMKGNVIGVATVQLADGQNLNFAIPSKKILVIPRIDPEPFANWAAETHSRAGLKAAAEGDFEASLKLYERSVQILPTANGYDGLGRAFHALGKYDDAIGAYQEALKIDPDAAKTYFHLGEVYERKGDWKDAAENYREASTRDPGDGTTHQNLAIAFMHLDERDAAMKEYEKLRSIDANLAAQLLEKLKQHGS